MNKPTIIAIAFLSAILFWGIAHAGPLAMIYYTNSAAGKENSAAVPVTVGTTIRSYWACNYSTSAGMVLMAFDSAALPGNGANPNFPVANLPEATASTSFASCATISLPGDGYAVQKGFSIACSTTGAQLTVDTTSGGDCKFWVAH